MNRPAASLLFRNISPLFVRSVARALCAMALSATLAGCAPKQNDSPETLPPPAGVTEPSWPFWPDDMRIHPLTRLASHDGGTVIEARVEFLDRFGDLTKCYGQIELGVFDIERTTFDQTPIGYWTVDLVNLPLNRTHFDDVTRTYLFKLEIERETLPHRAEVRVIYEDARGTTFTDRHELRRR